MKKMDIDILVNTTLFPGSDLLSQEISDKSTNDAVIEQFKRNWDVKLWTQGFFTEEYISDINVHWLKFDPPSDSSFIILAVLYTLIMIFGIFGNGLVIYMYCRCKTLRTSANILVVNLAVSDAGMLVKTPVFIYNCYYRGPILGDISCRIYAFLGGLTGITSIATLAAISFDRYLAIAYPLKRFSGNRVYACLVFTWIYALSFSIIPALDIGFGKYQYEGYLTSCSFDYLTEDQSIKTFILILFSAAFVVPVSLITFSYIRIIQVVRARSAKVDGKRDSIRHVREEDTRKQEIKLAVIVFTVISLWVFSWSPYATVALLGIFGQKHLITPLTSMIPALFCKTTSAIDPYVYAISHPKFREELRNLLGLSANDTKKTKNNRKVWSTETKMSSTRRFDSNDTLDDDVEVETLEIELSTSVNVGEYSSRRRDLKELELKAKERELKRQSSKASLLCLNPTFSNRASSIRRFSRRFSSLRRSQSRECKEDSTI